MKKIVLFGAGGIGRVALRLYGSDIVAFFADNDKNRVGNSYYGKEIISLDTLRSIAHKYDVIITSHFHKGQIAAQLETAGINNFSVFASYTPIETYMKRLLSHEIVSSKHSNVALFGSSRDSFIYADAILQNSELCVRYICDENNIGKVIRGFVIDDIEDIKHKIDALIITTEKDHLALAAILKKNYGKLFKIIDPFKRSAIYETDELIYNRYTGEDVNIEEEFNEKNSKSGAWESANYYVNKVVHDIPLFEFLEIETFNRCNGICSFCPANKNIDPRKPVFMDFGLFKKIISELSDMHYDGYLALSLNNEPLLDNRIVKLIKYAKENVPHAPIIMLTNGTLLTIDVFKRLMFWLDELIINNYSDNLSLHDACEEIKCYVDNHPELKKKVTILLRKQNEILNSRGGSTTPNRNNLKSIEGAKCTVPYQKMSIRSDGKVSLCCNDVYGRYTLGDLSVQTLVDVWYGRDYNNLRNVLFNGRENHNYCKTCDVYGISVP